MGWLGGLMLFRYSDETWVYFWLVKFIFSKRPQKLTKIFTVDLTLRSKCQIYIEDFVKLVAFLENINFTTKTRFWWSFNQISSNISSKIRIWPNLMRLKYFFRLFLLVFVFVLGLTKSKGLQNTKTVKSRNKGPKTKRKYKIELVKVKYLHLIIFEHILFELLKYNGLYNQILALLLHQLIINSWEKKPV